MQQVTNAVRLFCDNSRMVLPGIGLGVSILTRFDANNLSGPAGLVGRWYTCCAEQASG